MDALQANQPYTYQVLNDIMFTDRTCYEIEYDLDTYNPTQFSIAHVSYFDTDSFVIRGQLYIDIAGVPVKLDYFNDPFIDLDNNTVDIVIPEHALYEFIQTYDLHQCR